MARIVFASLVALALALPAWGEPTPVAGTAAPIEETVGDTAFTGQWG